MLQSAAKLFICMGLALLLASDASARGAGAEEELVWESYVGRTADRGRLEGELTHVEVPESRARPAGAKIRLAVVRYRSTNPNPGPPIVYLAGGPGGSSVSRASFFATHPVFDMLAHGDVIGVDQRGLGLTQPNLFEAPEFTYELPLDRAVTAADLIDAYGEAVRRCGAHWAEQGVDLASYNTRESADDLDAVRQALGYDKIALYGESYGSHLGLAYLKRHGDHVARAVFSRCEGPDHTWKLPSTVQAKLEQLGAIVAADKVVGEKVPDLVGSIRDLIESLNKEPRVVEVPQRQGGTVKVTVGSFDLQLILSRLLGGHREMQTIPAAIHQLSQGNWGLLGGIALGQRRDRIEGAMPIWMDMASGASPSRMKRIERESKDPSNLLGDAINFPYHPALRSVCGNPELGDEFRGPVRCKAPVLFVSGDLDPRTPAANVEDLGDGLPGAVHVVVTNTSHSSREIESDEYRALLRDFLSGKKVESRTIELAPLRFVPVDVDMTR